MNLSNPHIDWVTRQIIYEDALREIDEVFQSLGIQYMVIKGSYLICSGLASQIASRRMVDIDILIRKKDFTRCLKLLSDHKDFRIHKPDAWFFERAFTYKSGKHPLKIELHYQLNMEERFVLPTDELFERGKKQTAMRCLPGIEDALLILICHALVHISWQLKESVFDEIELYLQQSDFSWEKFNSILKTTGIEAFGHALLRRYAAKKGSVLPEFERKYFREMLLFLKIGRGDRNSFNRFLRRVFFEFPFVRNPFKLINRVFLFKNNRDLL